MSPSKKECCWYCGQEKTPASHLRDELPLAAARRRLDRRGRINRTLLGWGREARLKSQEGLCAICAAPIEGLVAQLDHDHINGQDRGALCKACNVGLGFFRDDTRRLRDAITYLEKWRALHKLEPDDPRRFDGLWKD